MSSSRTKKKCTLTLRSSYVELGHLELLVKLVGESVTAMTNMLPNSFRLES